MWRYADTASGVIWLASVTLSFLNSTLSAVRSQSGALVVSRPCTCAKISLRWFTFSYGLLVLVFMLISCS